MLLQVFNFQVLGAGIGRCDVWKLNSEAHSAGSRSTQLLSGYPYPTRLTALSLPSLSKCGLDNSVCQFSQKENVPRLELLLPKGGESSDLDDKNLAKNQAQP